MKPVIHNVLIVDRSTSMLGAKYNAAMEGIRLELEELKKDENASYTQTIVEFSCEGPMGKLYSLKEHCFMIPLANVHSFTGAGADGNTPMYQAVGEVIDKLHHRVNKGEKVLVKIFTDGEENASVGKYQDPRELKLLIDHVESNHDFTVTFEGTKFDGERINREVGISFSKMSFHDNTERGMLASAKKRARATAMYTESLSRGVDIGSTFYLNVDEEDKKDGVQ